MCSVQEMQHIDQELSSELVESLINPAFINICAPLMGSNDPFFSLQLTGEGLWQWRKLHSHCLVFNSLQASLVKVGYRLSSSARSQVGMAVYRRVDFLKAILSTGVKLLFTQMRSPKCLGTSSISGKRKMKS